MTRYPIGPVSLVLSILVILTVTIPLCALTSVAPAVVASLISEIEDDDEAGDDDDGGGEWDDDDDDRGLRWNDDDHIPGFSRGFSGDKERGRDALARVDRELADLRQIKGDLDRKVQERRAQLKGPESVQPAAAAVDQSKRRVESAKKEASATASKVTQAERDAMRLLRELKDEREEERDELLEVENEAAEFEHNVQLAAEPVRRELRSNPRYRVAVELADGAQLRLAQVKEQQKAGRAGPRELVDALNEAKRANATVELLEFEKLAATPEYVQAKSQLAEARQVVTKQRALREAALKADPRFVQAKAAVSSARADQADASKVVADASKAKTDAASKLDRLKKQIKSFEGDMNRMIAAQRALDSRIKDREAFKLELEQKLAGK